MREFPYNSYFRHEYRLSVPEQLAQRVLLDFPSYIYIYIYIFRFIHIHTYTYIFTHNIQTRTHACILFANRNVEQPTQVHAKSLITFFVACRPFILAHSYRRVRHASAQHQSTRNTEHTLTIHVNARTRCFVPFFIFFLSSSFSESLYRGVT